MRSIKKNYRELLITVLAVAIAGYFANSALGFSPARLPVPTTNEGIHLGLAFDFLIHTPITTLSNKVDYVWGAGESSLPSTATDAYMPYARDAQETNVAGHDLVTWQSTHPDWIVYKCDRVTPADPFPLSNGQPQAVPLDITNPDVRAYQLQWASKYLDAGYGGIAFDNVGYYNYGACGVYKRDAQGTLVWTDLGYTNNQARFFGAVVSWAQAMSTSIKAKYPDARLSANIRPIGFPSVSNFEQLTPYVDNIYDEDGFLSYTAKITDATWSQEIQSLEFLNSQNKSFVVGSEVLSAAPESNTPDKIQWTLANYLLVKGSRSYTYIYSGASPYGSFLDRPEYHIPIGHATSARYASQGVQMRNYSGGLAIVNPSSTTSRSIRLTGVYTDTSGHPVNTITMAPATGIVLLSVSSTPTTPLAPVKTGSGGSSSSATKTDSVGQESASTIAHAAGETNVPTGGDSPSAIAAAALTSGVKVSIPTTTKQATPQIYAATVAIMIMTGGLLTPYIFSGRRS